LLLKARGRSRPCLLLAPARRQQLADESADQLAGVRGELTAFLGGGLVVDECRPDAPVHLLHGCKRVGGAEHLRAVLRERHIDCGGVLAVDSREAVGVKAPPQPIVRPHQPVLRIGKPLGQLGVAPELALGLSGKHPRRIRQRAAHRAPAFRSAHASRAAWERDRPCRERPAGRGPSRSRGPCIRQRPS
jgi:hypothetical protein